MKTLVLEIKEDSYQTILNLPKNQCRVINDDELSTEELDNVKQIMTQIQQGDYSEFEDWETVKKRLLLKSF
jgi:hypothetical protein